MRCMLGCERSGAPLHRFPNPKRFPEQFNAWVVIVGGSPDDYLLYKHQRICDIHFKMEDRNRNNRLNALAVPSLHLPMWCRVPDAATSSSVVTSKDELLTMTEDESGPSNIKPDEEILDDNKSRLELSVDNIGDITVQSPVDVPSHLTTTANFINDDHNYCSKPGLAQLSDLDVQPPDDGSSNLSTTANLIDDEHNYCSRPRLAPLVDIAGPPTASVSSLAATKLNTGEHSNHSKISTSFRRGNRTSQNPIPSHLITKLKTTMRQVKNLKREVLRLRKRGLSFKARLENAEKLSENAAFQVITKKMTNPGKMFTMMQFREGNKKPKGRRFSTEEKILSLSIFKRSSKCYSLLAKQFALPSKKSLKSLLSTVKLNPGINAIVFEKIKKTLLTMNTDKKLCTLIFDEMSITPQIHYDASKDQLKGFTCNGQKIADHVLVFMVKGIKANFKQPVAYYFTNSLNKTELKSTLIDVIKNVQATGLRVMCTVCDQSNVNVSTINSLVEDTKAQYLQRGRDFRFTHFKVNNKNIIPLYDVPHLIKGIRNNLLNKDLIYKDEYNSDKKIKWEYFEMLYAADKCYGELRVAHKLTEEHINKEKIKKMKVKTAAQVFSHSVAVATEHLSARGDLPPQCRDLIPLVIMLDKVFDSLNSNTFHIPNGKIYKGSVKRNSPHHLLWNKAIIMLKTVKFITKKKCGEKVRIIESTVPSILNFIKTLEGVQNLWKILHEKYSFDTLLTRHLNQDPVENFFGNIRSYGVRNVAPNCVGFEGAYKSLLLNNYSTPHSIQANCEEDQNDCLQTLDFFLTGKPSPNIPYQKNMDYVFNEEILSSNETITDNGQRNYVCGWVLTKYFKNIKACKKCKSELCEQKENVNNSLINSREYNKKKKWLCYPSKDVERIFQEIQRITCIFLKKDVPKYNLKENIKMMCDTLIDYSFKCNIHKEKLQTYFVDITIKVLIYSWCRSINRILSGKITNDDHDNELKIAAQMYYIKHKHNKNHK